MMLSNEDSHSQTEVQTLFDAVEARLPSRLKLFAKLSTERANDPIHPMTVGNVMGGMRGLPSMLWEISGTDQAGIKYHGRTLNELQTLLPKWRGSEQVSPEAMLWYLYTASVPTRSELEQLAADIARRAELPPDVEAFCDVLPPETPSAQQMVMCLAQCSLHSKFNSALLRGAPKTQMWRHALEDALDGVAWVAMLAARIHANKYRRGRGRTTPIDPTADIAHNFARRMGRGADADFAELIRLYWALHMDHGANVSAHSMRLSGSAWTDPYLAMASGLISGTGVLHAGAITHALRYNAAMAAALGPEPDAQAVEAYILRTLERGQVVPGYGHALLRGADPRLAPILRFVATHPVPAHAPDSGAMLRLVARTSTLVPDILRRHVPKMKSPAPNVDSLSGVLMHAHGLDTEFILIVMGCSRGMGGMAQYVWDRALCLPIERPLSITMEQVMEKARAKL